MTLIQLGSLILHDYVRINLLQQANSRLSLPPKQSSNKALELTVSPPASAQHDEASHYPVILLRLPGISLQPPDICLCPAHNDDLFCPCIKELNTNLRSLLPVWLRLHHQLRAIV